MRACRRRLTLEELERYEKLATDFAERLYLANGVSATAGADDAHDICTDAFLARKQPWRKAEDKDHRRALIRTYIKNHVMNALRHRLTAIEKVNTRAISVDEAPHGTFDEDGNEENIETALLTDEGFYADLTRNYEDPSPEPKYVTMTRDEVRRIMTRARRSTRSMKSDTFARTEARVCRALTRTLTKSVARKKPQTGRTVFALVLKNFQVRFAQCFRAWREEARYFGCSKNKNFRD